jgi:PAS domain S-box-containing protein
VTGGLHAPVPPADAGYPDEIRRLILRLVGGGLGLAALWVALTAWLVVGLYRQQQQGHGFHLASSGYAAEARLEALGVGDLIREVPVPSSAADGRELAAAIDEGVLRMEARMAHLRRLQDGGTNPATDAALAVAETRLVALRGEADRGLGLDPPDVQRLGPALTRVQGALAELEEMHEASASAASVALADAARFRLGGLAAFTVVLGFLAVLLERRTLRMVDAAAARERSGERALEESDAACALLQHAARIGHWRWDPEAGRVVLSEEGCRILGRASDVFSGAYAAILSVIHPEDRAAFRGGVRAARKRGEPFDLEHRILRPDGVVRVVRTQAEVSYPDDAGGPPTLSGTVWDVTERRDLVESLWETGAMLRLVMSQSRSVVWVRDAETLRMLYLSPSFETVFGWPRDRVMDTLEGFLAHIHPDDRGLAHARLMAARQAPVETEYRLLQPDGSVRWITARLFPVRDGTGTVRRIAGISDDVTQIKASQEADRRHRAELADVTRASSLGELASAIAHEINQPLFAIASYAQGGLNRIEKGRMDPGDVRHALEQIAQQAERSGQLVSRLRDLARGAGPITGPEDVNDLVQEAVEIALQELPDGADRVRLELGKSLPPVQADRVQVEQVVVNLVRNAVEATAATRNGEVVVHTANHGPQVRVIVNDNGPGIAPQLADRLFLPFASTKPGSMGMGLAICRSVVEAHGGNLWFEPVQPSGASLVFSLPCAGGAEPAEA